MGYSNGITIISLFLTSFITILVGLKNRGKRGSFTFLLIGASMSFWVFTNFMADSAVNSVEALLWSKAAIVGPSLLPILFYYLVISLYFDQNIKHKKEVGLIYLFCSAFIIALSPTAFNIQHVYIQEWGTSYIPGALYYFLFMYLFVGFLWPLKLLLRIIKHGKEPNRSQAKLVLTGVAISVTLPLFASIIFPIFGYSETSIFGPPTVIFFLSFIAYAIIRHRFMDITLVLRRYSVFLASIISIVIPVILLKLFYYSMVEGNLLLEIVSDTIFLVLAVSAFPTLRDKYYHIANKYFFSSLYDERELITTLSEKLTSTIEIERVFEYISNIIVNYFKSKTVSILLFDQENKQYLVRHDVGHEKGSETVFVEDRGFYSNIILRHQVILIDELIDEFRDEYKSTFDKLLKYNISVLVPLTLKDRIIGLLALGAKESKDLYNEEDIRVLGVIGASSAIAIQNSLLFEETKNFGIKLKKEVDSATKELRSANQKLRQLDAAKSEFISIASHQLRTPLTVIKGYVSMMIDGNFGKVSLRLNEVLNKVFYSNERLIQLVENLLNVSRIESGKLQYIMKPTNLEEIVTSVIDELLSTALEKKLLIEYKEPESELPLLVMDEEKIRQVVLNLIDNAIKYTHEGSVIVSLKLTKKEVIFCVDDSGIGVTKEDLSNLFKKFSRGKKTYLVHPGGTGLGLFVAQQMIEAHKGRVWAESKGEGKGSRFYFSLPAPKLKKGKVNSSQADVDK